MKKSACLAMVIAAIGVSSAVAGVYDLNPAPWRTDPQGTPPTTYQSWEFNDATNPSAPDVDDNPYGTAELEVKGSFPYTRHMSEHLGHQGVWKFEDWVEIEIPNSPVANPYKEVWLQVTYFASGVPQPYTVLPGYDNLELIDDVAIDDNYRHATFHVIIEPNPEMESVWIEPLHCTLYIDSLIVETICAPEPMTLAMMAIGGVLMIRRR